MRQRIFSGILVGLLFTIYSPHLFGESPQNFAFEVKFGPYKPSIDSEFTTGTHPYQDIFGSSSFFFFQLELDWQFWQGVGNLGVGGSVGFGQDLGKALNPETGDHTGDTTIFNMIPLNLAIIYRFDYLAQKWNIPLVPFVKLGLDYYIWWILNNRGSVAEAEGRKGRGGTWGFHVNVGLNILLDFLAPTMAKTFDNEIGVNHTYLFAEFLYANVNNFGSSSSFNLGDITFMGGLALEF
jgi:hypothetical protein